jgi:hypothetical protein
MTSAIAKTEEQQKFEIIKHIVNSEVFSKEKIIEQFPDNKDLIEQLFQK